MTDEIEVTVAFNGPDEYQAYNDAPACLLELIYRQARELAEAASALRSSGEALVRFINIYAPEFCEMGQEEFVHATAEQAAKHLNPGGRTVRFISSDTATPANAWRPIAEAPRDGRYVLLVHESSGGRPYAGMWCRDDKQWADERGCIRVPTHFQPLPTPPTSTKGG